MNGAWLTAQPGFGGESPYPRRGLESAAGAYYYRTRLAVLSRADQLISLCGLAYYPRAIGLIIIRVAGDYPPP